MYVQYVHGLYVYATEIFKIFKIARSSILPPTKSGEVGLAVTGRTRISMYSDIVVYLYNLLYYIIYIMDGYHNL